MNLVHGQIGIAYHQKYLELVEKLIPVMPDSSLDSFFLWNSGSEAVEASIKMARYLTKRQNVIVMHGAYHGRTFGAMALTRSKTVYFDGSEPLMVGFAGPLQRVFSTSSFRVARRLPDALPVLAPTQPPA